MGTWMQKDEKDENKDVEEEVEQEGRGREDRKETGRGRERLWGELIQPNPTFNVIIHIIV